jgi:hypothetical protein
MRSNSMRRGINNAMRSTLFTEYLNEQRLRREKEQSKTKENKDENNSN